MKNVNKGIKSFNWAGVGKEVFMNQFSLAKPFLYAVSSLLFTFSAFAWENQDQTPTLQNKRLEVAVARLLAAFQGANFTEEQLLIAIENNVDENGVVAGLIEPAQKLLEFFSENGYCR